MKVRNDQKVDTSSAVLSVWECVYMSVHGDNVYIMHITCTRFAWGQCLHPARNLY